MSELMTDEEQIIWFLREFENAEDEQLESCELEIYGEDEQGREGTCTISVQEIAKKAADFIEKLMAERDNALAQNAELVAQVERLNNFSNERIARAATLRSCIEKVLTCEELVFNSDVVLVVSSELADDIRCALDSTPAQHLRDRDAEVVEKYYYMGWEHSLSTKADDGDHYGCGKRLAKEFAEKVRSGL